MKLYFAPGACSMIVRMVLIQAGERFEPVLVDIGTGEQRTPGFLSLNPKGKVPVLVRDDGSVLTELGTILTWLALRHADAALLPEDAEARVRVQEMLEYCIATLHTLGTMRIFVPAAFGAEDDAERIREEGRAILARGLLILNDRLAPGAGHGGAPTVADFALYWLALGAVMSGVALPAAVQEHYARMGQLDAVRKGLADEGFASA